MYLWVWAGGIRKVHTLLPRPTILHTWRRALVALNPQKSSPHQRHSQRDLSVSWHVNFLKSSLSSNISARGRSTTAGAVALVTSLPSGMFNRLIAMPGHGAPAFACKALATALSLGSIADIVLHATINSIMDLNVAACNLSISGEPARMHGCGLLY